MIKLKFQESETLDSRYATYAGETILSGIGQGFSLSSIAPTTSVNVFGLGDSDILVTGSLPPMPEQGAYLITLQVGAQSTLDPFESPLVQWALISGSIVKFFYSNSVSQTFSFIVPGAATALQFNISYTCLGVTAYPATLTLQGSSSVVKISKFN